MKKHFITSYRWYYFHKKACRKGIPVVMNDEIHQAFNIPKTSTHIQTVPITKPLYIYVEINKFTLGISWIRATAHAA